MIRYHDELNNLYSLVRKQFFFFAGYLLMFWSMSCLLAASLASSFDGRLRNLIDTMKHDSFIFTILVYTLTKFVVYVWIHFEKEKERKLAELQPAAEQPARKSTAPLIVRAVTADGRANKLSDFFEICILHKRITKIHGYHVLFQYNY